MRRPLDEPGVYTDSPVVEVRNVTRRFGAKVALDDVSLTVPAGSVFGLIGENGAGKTTLIKQILGFLVVQQGSVRVFGRDPAADPVGVLSRVGYLSEDVDLPDALRLGELVACTRAFYPKWDDAYAERLQSAFGLRSGDRIKELSKGQKARAGLLLALAYRPELLVLDEPSSGLDPAVRRDILGAIVRTIADEGRTVVFSSHLLHEIERVCDYVAMVHGGQIVLCGDLESIRTRHRRITLRFPAARPDAPTADGPLTWEGSGREWSAVADIRLRGEIAALAERTGAEIVGETAVSLEDIFVARVGYRPLATVKE